ncbi:hypothetical protein ACVLV4_003037 [Rathayibacter agropyri]
MAIANRLLDDGADPSLVSTSGDRGDGLNVTGTTVVSEIYSELSTLVASFGAAAQKDTGEFDQLGVNSEVQDAQVCEVAQ